MALSRFGCTLAEVEREHILETLTCCDGNRSRAAKFLDISLRCLRMKLRRFVQSGSMVPPARQKQAPSPGGSNCDLKKSSVIHGDPSADQIGRQLRQPIELSVGPGGIRSPLAPPRHSRCP